VSGGGGRWPRSVAAAAVFCGAAIGLVGGACEELEVPDPTYSPVVDAGDEAWTHRAILFLWGRHPQSIHEVEVLLDLVRATDRSTVAREMARAPEAVDHWRATVLDLLAVPRVGGNGSRHCNGVPTTAADSTLLAEFVRDHDPRDQPGAEDGIDGPWRIADLAASSLLLDDVTPLLRGRLITMFSRQGNAQTLGEELSYRQRSGETFGEMYVGRQLDCLPCHNSAFSTTGSDDPATDRTWELPGLLERAVYGADGGVDPDELWPFFRRLGVLAEYGFTVEVDLYEPLPDRGCWPTEEPGCYGCDCEVEVCDADPGCCDGSWHEGCVDLCNDAGACPDPLLVQPWGISAPDCGRMLNPDALKDDLVAEGAWFVTAEDAAASIWDLERHLRAGFDALRARGAHTPGADGAVDGAEAFAYLTAANLADRVWAQAFGSRLTLDHGFARNREQRDVLASLTDRLLASDLRFSELLTAVTEHPLFSHEPAAVVAEEGESPYALPRLFDPWSVEREAVDERGNSFGDTLHRLDGRVLVRSLYSAMGWDPPIEFHGHPDGGQGGMVRLHEVLGVHLKDALPGFRAVAMQTLLAWEAAFATCRDTVPHDWGCATNADWGCPDCPCEAQVCEQMPSCCAPSGGWSEVCVDLCAASDAGCGPPEPPSPDFIEQLVAEADAAGATLGDAVASLKDRLHADPRLEDANERVVLARWMDADLDAQVGPGADEQLRRACAVFLAAPQFVLGGDPGEDRAGTPVPVEVPGATRADRCEALAAVLFDGRIECDEGLATLSGGPP